MKINFKTYDTNNNLIDTPLLGAGVYTTDTSYAYADNVDGLNSIGVFLNKKNDHQTFIIFQSNTRDTIHVFYESENVFVSNGCGYRVDFNIKDVTFSSSSIEDVRIQNAKVSATQNDTHLEVIYK